MTDRKMARAGRGVLSLSVLSLTLMDAFFEGVTDFYVNIHVQIWKNTGADT